MKRILTITAICTLSASPAYAGSLTQNWSGEASLSGARTSGNTSTTDVGLAFHLKKEAGPWAHKFDTTYDLGRADGQDTNNRFFIAYQIDRKINERFYGFATADYFTDGFGPFKQGNYLGAGLGYQFIQSEPLQWALEAGAGFRSQKSRESGFIPSLRQDEFALSGGSQFKYALNDAVSFYNNTEILWSDSDTYIWNDIGITANLSGNLAARFSFRIDTHSNVPVGTVKTDTITRGALVYTLK